MPDSHCLTRRDALKTAALGALSLSLLGATALDVRAAAPAPAPVQPRDPARGLKLGVATFTFAKLSVEGIIEVLQQLEFTGVSLYKSHVPWADGTPEQCRAIIQKFTAAGITVTSTGMIELPNDEAVIRRAFDNVRAAGLSTLCGWLKNTDSLPLVDKLVKEYDLKIAIHNHGPTEALATGRDVWQAVQPFDRRIGLCLDVAHGFRAGENPAETIRMARERMYQVHLRDTGATGGGMKDPQAVVVGHGLLDFRSIVAALLETKYSAYADFEYEKKEVNRVPGLAESVGYVRGLVAALT